MTLLVALVLAVQPAANTSCFGSTDQVKTTARLLANMLQQPAPQISRRCALQRLSCQTMRQRKATLYELGRHGRHLPDELVLHFSRRSPLWDRFGEDPLVQLWRLLLPERAPPETEQLLVLQLRQTALEISSIGDTDVRGYLRHKLRRDHGRLTIMGKQLDRLAEPPQQDWRDLWSYPLYWHLYAAGFKSDLADWTASAMGVKDVESPQELQRAIAGPLVRDKAGRAKQIGDIAVVVNGWFNFFTSAPAIFRLARYVRGPVVLTNANPNGKDGFRLRRVKTLLGHRVPPQLRGKIWVIGNLAPNLVTWPQASDILVQHLAVVDGAYSRLQRANPALAGLSSFSRAQVVAIGHSQGGPTIMAARSRLNRVGLDDVLDRVVAVNSLTGSGTSLADDIDSPQDIRGLEDPALDEKHGLARVSKWVLGTVFYQDVRRSYEMFDPDFVESMFHAYQMNPEQLVDLSYTTRAGFLSYDPQSNKAEPVLLLLAWISTDQVGPDGALASDGLVPTRSSAAGKRVVVDAEHKGHLIAWEDQDTIDRIVENLR